MHGPPAGDATQRVEVAPARPRPPRQPMGGRPKWAIPLALLGLLALALAAILGWGVAPSREQMPESLDVTRDLTGTANALLNQQALQSGDFAGALVTNMPVTEQRTVRVLNTTAAAARVQEDRTLMIDGQQVGSGSNTWAVDRRSLEPATNVPQEWEVQPHQGLTVSFPVGAQQRDYTGWVTDTQTATPLRFLREELRGGVNTFVYEALAPAAPIRDPAVLSALPSSLSKPALQSLSPSLAMGPEATLMQVLPGLPDQVPITYSFESRATYWVEPSTGVIVDMQQQAIRTGTISGPGGAMLATMPVYNVDTRFTDSSVTAAAQDANNRRNALNTVGSTWPWVLGTLGALALIAGLLGLLARRRPRRQEAPPPAYRPDERTTSVDMDAARRMGAAQPGQPQPPYVGQTPHTGPYREARAGEEQRDGEGEQRDDQPGQPPPREPSR